MADIYEAKKYQYKGQTVDVHAHRTSDREMWEPGYLINGVVHTMDPRGKYPYKLFPTEAEALTYARTAAEHRINTHPNSYKKK